MSAISALKLLTRLKNRRIHLGVTGSIACYKTLDLLRALLACGIHVSATLTPAARHFVTPLLFEALGAMPVYTDMFAEQGTPFAHLEPGQHAAAFFIIPASADILSRLATGSAPDMLSAQLLAFSGPVLAAPAMNPRMWKHPAVQANVALLKQRGVTIVSPESGNMACGDQGEGRLASTTQLLLFALRALSAQDMRKDSVLVTLGPTREPWDGVRFWSNPSTGTMGTCLALAAWLRGAKVFAVTGPGVPDELLPRDLPGLVRIDVTTAADMYEQACGLWKDCGLGFFSAAVADFSPVPYGKEKFKKDKGQEGFSIRFTPNKDILAALSEHRQPGQKVLGFAAETAASGKELLELARAKRQRKNADVLAANRVGTRGAGFAGDTNSMTVIDASGREEVWPEQSKADVAWDLCTWLLHA